jgi:hypothetical protein
MARDRRRWRDAARPHGRGRLCCISLTTIVGHADRGNLDESTDMNTVAVIAYPGRTSEMLFDAIASASRDADVSDQ